MKYWIAGLFLILQSGFVSAQTDRQSIEHTPGTPDILLYGRIDNEAASSTLQRLRRLFNNQGIIDPFSMKFDKPLNWILPISAMEGTPGQKIYEDIVRMFDMDVRTARMVLIFDEFEHHIDQVQTHMITDQAGSDAVKLDVFAGIRDLQVKASQLRVLLKLSPRGKSQDEICYLPPELRAATTATMPHCDDDGKSLVTLFDIRVPKPMIESKRGEKLDFTFEALVTVTDHISVKITETCFDEMYSRVMKDPTLMSLSKLNLSHVPNITLGVGRHAYTLPASEIQAFVRGQEAGIRSALLNMLMSSFREKIGAAILGLLDYENLRRDIWVSDAMMSGFDTRSIRVVDHRTVELSIDGHFCSAGEFQAQGMDCVNNQSYLGIYRSKWNESDLAESKRVAEKMIADPKNQLLFSLSESYVNRLMYETVENGFWEKLLGDEGVKLGPKKAFILFGEAGSSGKLVLDVIFPVPKKYRIVLGKKDLRFPLIFDLETYFGSESRQTKRGVSVTDPVFTVKIGKAYVDSKTLRTGMPEDDMPSYLGRLFKGKVIKTIAKKLKGQQGQEIPLVTLPALSGLGLEGKRVVSDGFGRATITLDSTFE